MYRLPGHSSEVDVKKPIVEKPKSAPVLKADLYIPSHSNHHSLGATFLHAPFAYDECVPLQDYNAAFGASFMSTVSTRADINEKLEKEGALYRHSLQPEAVIFKDALVRREEQSAREAEEALGG